ncbi:hypothetical protein [Microbacterium sp.]|uniref:hypothetical protein n=1 Tax=Microbacterium sp. TaxID=51671 RepID=UPI00281278AD|nr:hypothetical protein [Microbacterium sp.]
MLVLTGTETPIPTPTMTVAPEAVTPGFVGFAAIVIVLIAVILLIWDMNRRIRRVRYREEVRAELDAEQAARSEGGASPKDATTGIADHDAPDAGTRTKPEGDDSRTT